MKIKVVLITMILVVVMLGKQAFEKAITTQAQKDNLKDALIQNSEIIDHTQISEPIIDTQSKIEFKEGQNIYTYVESKKPEKCAVCKKSMVDKSGKYTHYGTIVQMNDTPEARELYPEIAGKTIAVCPVCVLKSYGVQFPIEEQQ